MLSADKSGHSKIGSECLNSIYCSAAILRAAMTSSGVRQQRLFVVNSDLFTALDVTEREKQNVPVQRFHVGVGIAGVIDVVGAVAAARAVQTEAAVYIANAQMTPATRAL